MNGLLRSRTTLLLVALGVAANARAGILTVGIDDDCGFSRPEAAFASAMDGDEIRLAGSFPAVAAEITDGEVTIRGGFPSCAAPMPTGTTVLDGQGEPRRSILTVRGDAMVRIVDVDFINGDEGDDTDDGGPDDGAGGCVDFAATGSLSLLRSRISECRASAGGGLWFEARNGAAVLELHAVEITHNAARVVGGGIAIVGETDVSITGSGALSDNEVVDGDGGGLFVAGAARVEIGPTGLEGVAAPYLARNRAFRHGAAIAVRPGARVRVYTADSQRPLGIDGNVGAASALRVDSTEAEPAAICLWNVDVTRNESGSIGVARGPLAGIHVNPDTAAGELACGKRPAAARECAASSPCNRVVDNDAVAAGSGLFRAEMGAGLSLNRLSISGNHPFAPMLVVIGASPAPIALQSTAVCRNAFEGGLLRVIGAADASFRQVTIVDNEIDGDCTLCFGGPPEAAPARLLIANAIIDQPWRTTLDNQRADAQLQLVVSNAALTDISTVPADSDALVRLSSPGDLPPLVLAGYVDRAHGNYELATDSVLVDFARVEDDMTLDALGRARTRDLPLVIDLFGPRDLGAFETRRDAGDIFEDAFE